ncbi:MAG: YicC family protein [Clostridia bacterium]|nr:YicC family protein [Clostridia bacterium]
MNSMTGFGRGELERNGHSFVVEIKSVNHRYLDMNIRSPRVLLFLEDDVRNVIKERIQRGHLDVFITYKDHNDTVGNITVNENVLREYFAAAEKISEITGRQNDLDIASAMKLDGVLDYDDVKLDEDLLRSSLRETVSMAVDRLTEAREKEGIKMVTDLLERKETLDGIISDIEKREPCVVEEYREKLRQKIEEYLSDTEIDENRFNTEILYFSDRASITEEIVRIHAHLEELEALLSSEESTGRKMDFLIQELNREFNTIGSKASDLSITKGVLAAKGEIERIREQIQNME